MQSSDLPREYVKRPDQIFIVEEKKSLYLVTENKITLDLSGIESIDSPYFYCLINCTDDYGTVVRSIDTLSPKVHKVSRVLLSSFTKILAKHQIFGKND